ncbi:hypothetical protein PoB_002397900 [Plakobranchus ocellatus]|uniref:Uncharacterized protein n=1 Tax=Plakobranchus ocellatus TaxID=259542 RepID=A0AAV3ZST9_9GAST|nr:hypothetical protein PoB_002397900 [Plakobranchus ocellatus]
MTMMRRVYNYDDEAADDEDDDDNDDDDRWVKKPHVLADKGDLFDAHVLAELLLELKVFETMVLSSSVQQMLPIAS